MSRKKTAMALAAALAAAVLFLSAETPAFAASKEQILHRFDKSGDGGLP